MYQVEQQTPIKNSSCFRCHEMGHWAKYCPRSPATRSPITPNRSPISAPASDYPPTHCPCGAGFCEIQISKSKENPDRQYYTCPGKFEYRCNHFKWCNMLKKEEILNVQPRKYPICGCGAGVCRVETEKSGPDAGISCFVCHIEKGSGACNFKQPKFADSELPLEEDHELNCLSPEDEMVLDAIERRACKFSLEEDQVQMDLGLDRSSDIAQGISSGFPGLHRHSAANNISGNTLDLELATENNELLLKMGDSQANNVDSSITRVAKTIRDPISPGFNPLNMPEDIIPSDNSPSLLELSKQPSVLTDKQDEGIFEALEKLSLSLPNDFKSTSPKNHDNVINEQSTFAPLDYLRVDYGLFHLQAIEYIKQATAHACIEHAIKDDATSRELMDRYKKEKTRFEDTVRSFCEAGKAYMASYGRLTTFREKVSRVRDMLADLEDELLCCEVENANDKENLLHITKSMSECKESMQNAYQEVEDAFKQL